MDNLETYNRVQSLESPLYKNIVLSSHILLSTVILIGGISLIAMEQPWPHTLITMIAAFISCLSLISVNHWRIKTCQYCKRPLNYVTRPFLLTPKYLSLQGNKYNEAFYTQCHWGSKPFQKRWAKISNRSLACHHCRLSEEKQSEYYESASATELEEITQTKAVNI